MKMPLQHYLGGHVLRMAMMEFEDALNPFVKNVVRMYFPENPDDPYTIAFKEDLSAQKRDRDVQRKTLKQEHTDITTLLHQLQPQLDVKDKTAKNEAKVLQKRKLIIAQALSKLDHQDTEGEIKTPDPRWIRECREFFGRTMKPFINADNRWDVFILVQVMRGFLPQIFSKTFSDDFQAKEFLTSILRVVEARNGRAHQQSHFIESDALTAMSQMVQVLRLCKSDIAAKNVTTILEEAKLLVDTARDRGQSESSTHTHTGVNINLNAQEYNAQLAYVSLNNFSAHIESTVGDHHFQDGGISFGKKLDSKWHSVIKSQKENFRRIAELRNWYFHHVGIDPNISATFRSMENVVTAIETVQTSSTVSPWQSPIITTKTTTPITIILNPPMNRMSIPVAREHVLVGRKTSIEAVTTQLLAGPSTRVLIHGDPGVGKDTVAAAVVHNDNVQQLGGVQAWLQASSDLVFRRQLIDVFLTHRHWVVQGCETDASECIEEIFAFLRESGEGWLFVIEDMSSESMTAINLLSETKGVGRVLITSQAPLHESIPSFSSIKLEPFTTDDSVELLRSMNLFSKKVSDEDASIVDEMILKAQVQAAVSTLGSQLPEKYTRLAYKTPPATEKAKATKERQRQLRVGLHEHQELTRPEFRKFLEEESGNLPLVISLYGHMLRAADQITTTLQLIEQIRKIELTDVDKSGRNPLTDKHYFGMVKSVKFMLQRLNTNASFTENERKDALALLTAMSMLDRTQTQLALFLDHNLEQLIETLSITVEEQLSQTSLGTDHDCVSVFRQRANLERARDVLCDVGILRPSADSTKFVGVMHQLVQRCVRDQLVYNPHDGVSVYSSAHTIIDVVRQMLLHQIYFSSSPNTRRDVAPCVDAWCAVVLPVSTRVSNSNMIEVHEDDLGLLGNLGVFLRDLQGDEQHALVIHERVCAIAEDMLPQDHPDIATAMGNLASTFAHLGRYDEALNLEQECLEFRKRVLPQDHPEIATSMNNLALVFSDMGRHDDALNLEQQVLAFRKRVLPKDHPDIATSMGNLALTFSQLGRHADALNLEQEVLEFQKRVLPQNHPDIATSMSNLAMSFSDMGRHVDALNLEQQVLEFRKRVLPQDHPHIATSIDNVASTFSHLGRYADALKLQQEVLEFRERVLPQNHPDIATSMNNLAVIFSHLGRYADALKLKQKVLELRKRVLPQDHPDIATSMNNLALSFLDFGQHDDALKLQQQVLNFLKRVLPHDHPDIATSMNNLALTFSHMERNDDALKLQEEVLEFRKRVLPQDHPDIATSMSNLATECFCLSRHADALELEQDALEFRERVLPHDHPDLASSMGSLGHIYFFLGDFDKALTHTYAAIKIHQQGLPPDETAIAKLHENVHMYMQEQEHHDKHNHPGVDYCCNPTCSKPNPQHTCSRCGVANYCDRTCQKSHWKTHNQQCRPKRTADMPTHEQSTIPNKRRTR